MGGSAFEIARPRTNRDRPEILMVVPRYTPQKRLAYYEFPLGMAYISSCLRKAGHSVAVANLNQSQDCYERLAEISGSLLPKLVMTGGLSAHYEQIRCLIRVVRRSSPSSRIVVGGGIVTASPALMWQYLMPDFMVLGEGEITAVELADRVLGRSTRDMKAIEGIGYPGPDGALRQSPPRPPIADLDSLPFPDLEAFGIEEYLGLQRPNDNVYLYVEDRPRFFPVISSRGCPHKCTFCYHPLGQKYRSRSADNFIAEVEHVLSRYGVRNLAIFDELLSCNRHRLLEICRRLKGLSRRVRWMCQLRVDLVDPEMLQILKEAGCFMVSYGLESASDEVLRSMGKGISREQIGRALQLTREAGIGVQGYFIFGDPAETPRTVGETLRFWKEHRDFHITLGYVRPYPGSPLWEAQFPRSGVDELSFLEKCTCDPPNMTRLSPREWFTLKKDVQKALMENDHFGTFISGYRDTEGGEVMIIRCPHCGSTIEYRNFNQRILGIFKLSCRVCNQAMNMTPLAFEHVRKDYPRNYRAFQEMKEQRMPVYVLPCMDEGEFEAQRELLLDGVRIAGFLDADPRKQERPYQGLRVLDTRPETVKSVAQEGCGFLIPLTRHADELWGNLLQAGISPDRICRLDTLYVGPGAAGLAARRLVGEA